MNVRFWGTRGSVATPGQSTVRYGGNTSCTEVTTHAGNVLILDCGTGARLLGDHLTATSSGPIRGHIFITHTHWDHIQGFPFFAPVFTEGNQWVIYGPANGERDLEQALSGQMQYTYFPVELSQVSAALQCKDLGEGEFELDGVDVRCQYLNHPAVTLGYRFEDHGASLVYATDHEPFSHVLFPRDRDGRAIEEILHAGDRRHAQFVAGADLLIHDAQYTAEEYGNHRNWGHSTVEYVVQLALVAGVRQLALYHHDPNHDDTTLDRLQEHAQDLVRQNGGEMKVFVAREGDEIYLAGRRSRMHGGHPELSAPATPLGAHVLVVEDDWMLRDLVRDILTPEDYVVDLAGNGREALDRIETDVPDLLLLDMMMPEMDGFEVLRSIRASARTRNLPVIMLTASNDETRIAQGFRNGASDYMVKPFTPSQLRARVNEWLNRSAATETSEA